MPHMSRRSLFAMVAAVFAPRYGAEQKKQDYLRAMAEAFPNSLGWNLADGRPHLKISRTHTFGKMTERGWEFYQDQVVSVVNE